MSHRLILLVIFLTSATSLAAQSKHIDLGSRTAVNLASSESQSLPLKFRIIQASVIKCIIQGGDTSFSFTAHLDVKSFADSTAFDELDLQISIPPGLVLDYIDNSFDKDKIINLDSNDTVLNYKIVPSQSRYWLIKGKENFRNFAKLHFTLSSYSKDPIALIISNISAKKAAGQELSQTKIINFSLSP